MRKWWCCPIHLKQAIKRYVKKVCQAKQTTNTVVNDKLLDFLLASWANPVFYFPPTQEKQAHAVFIQVTVRKGSSNPQHQNNRFFASVGIAENEIKGDGTNEEGTKEDGTNEDGAAELYYEIDEEAWMDRKKTVEFEDDNEVRASALSFNMCPILGQPRSVVVEAIWASDEDEQNDESG